MDTEGGTGWDNKAQITNLERRGWNKNGGSVPVFLPVLTKC